MTISKEQVNQWTGAGFYYTRIQGEDGDSFILSFSGGDYPQKNYPTFERGVDYRITPGTGASVKAEFAIRPDYDPDVDAHWEDFEDSPFTTELNDYQLSSLSAMRFTATSGDMTVEMMSSTQIRVEE